MMPFTQPRSHSSPAHSFASSLGSGYSHHSIHSKLNKSKSAEIRSSNGGLESNKVYISQDEIDSRGKKDTVHGGSMHKRTGSGSLHKRTGSGSLAEQRATAAKESWDVYVVSFA